MRTKTNDEILLISFNRKVIESGGWDADVIADVQPGGLYDVTLHRVVLDETLPQETVFKCVLSIPDTQYQISRKGIYFPGKFHLPLLAVVGVGD